MKLLNRYTLAIQDKEVAKQYRLSFTNRIFITGIVLSLVRIIRLFFAFIIDDANEKYILFIPEFDVIRWVTMAI